MTIFLDTNILLDFLDRREPHYRAAAQIWTLAEQGTVIAHISAISLNNVFYILRKSAGVERAWEAVRTLRSTFDVVPLDIALLDEAATVAMPDLEDAIQAAAAVRAGASAIITRDARGFSASAVAAI